MSRNTGALTNFIPDLLSQMNAQLSAIERKPTYYAGYEQLPQPRLITYQSPNGGNP